MMDAVTPICEGRFNKAYRSATVQVQGAKAYVSSQSLVKDSSNETTVDNSVMPT